MRTLGEIALRPPRSQNIGGAFQKVSRRSISLDAPPRRYGLREDCDAEPLPEGGKKKKEYATMWNPSRRGKRFLRGGGARDRERGRN
jgi:hypothetical protein